MLMGLEDYLMVLVVLVMVLVENYGDFMLPILVELVVLQALVVFVVWGECGNVVGLAGVWFWWVCWWRNSLLLVLLLLLLLVALHDYCY